MIFGFCRKPYPDEVLYGYVCSVFRQNGFRNVQQINDFIGFGKITADYAVGLPFLKERIGNVSFPNVD